MTCDEAQVLLHALLDGELDAGHAREVEAHAASCARCTAQLRDFRAMRGAMSEADLKYAAPPALRSRIEAALPSAPRPKPTRRAMLKGFAVGTALSAVAATGLVVAVLRSGDDQRILGDVVSAHLRSLQAEHLTDVQSSDQHTVKPWFAGRLDLSPPVVDLTAQGFTLLGGRLDFIDGKAVAVVVYRRRVHVINLFVAPGAGVAGSAPRIEMVQGFHVRRWAEQGLRFIAISDLNADELQEFGAKFDAALRSGA